MEFYGSSATRLTLASPQSILLPKIHKTHIAQHHTSIFALLYVKCLQGSSTLVYGYIYCYILLNNLLTFPVLVYGATIVTSYCDVRYHSST